MNESAKRWRAENKEYLKAYNREWRSRNKERVRQWNKAQYEANPEPRRKYSRDYAKAHRAERNAYSVEWRRKNHDHVRETDRKWKENNPHKGKEYRAKRKLLAITHYGGKCECCEESCIDFLTIDHINGGGTKHRQEINRNGSPFYQWLRLNGWPEGYRVLCFNCNCAISFTGTCPHKRPR